MIRVVLVVALATALIAAATPAIDAGRTDRTATRLSSAADRLERAASSLVERDDPTARDLRGARRTLEVHLPERSWSAVGVVHFTIGGRRSSVVDTRDVISYRIGGGSTRTVRLPVDLRVRDGPLVLREPGRHRLRFTLLRDGGPVVLVERA